MNRHAKTFAACAAILLGSTTFAADEEITVDLASWDQDEDRVVSPEEWAAVFDEHKFFDKVDTNNNDLFDAKEAMEGVIDHDAAMDRDGGGTIEGKEFVSGMFDQHDTNDDDKLDDMEWAEFAASQDGSPLFN